MKKDGVPQRINKAKLRAMLLLQPEALSIAESTGLYQSHLDTERLDLSEPNEQGQRSQQEQSTVEARSEEQSHLHQKHRNVIELLPFGQKAVVEPDAVVNANNRYFGIADYGRGDLRMSAEDSWSNRRSINLGARSNIWHTTAQKGRIVR